MSKPQQGCEADLLQRVTIRWVRDEERATFDQLLEGRHYLASARLAGQTLRYVAELDGQWVALLTFSAAALHLKAREQWLRWTPRQRPPPLQARRAVAPLAPAPARPPPRPGRQQQPLPGPAGTPALSQPRLA